MGAPLFDPNARSIAPSAARTTSPPMTSDLMLCRASALHVAETRRAALWMW